MTPEIVSKAHDVQRLNTQHVEELHQLAEQWTGVVAYTQGLIDSVIRKWKDVADKVTGSAKMRNTKLLAAQVSSQSCGVQNITCLENTGKFRNCHV